jgi:hypothetical protein
MQSEEKRSSNALADQNPIGEPFRMVSDVSHLVRRLPPDNLYPQRWVWLTIGALALVFGVLSVYLHYSSNQ